MCRGGRWLSRSKVEGEMCRGAGRERTIGLARRLRGVDSLRLRLTKGGRSERAVLWHGNGQLVMMVLVSKTGGATSKRSHGRRVGPVAKL